MSSAPLSYQTPVRAAFYRSPELFHRKGALLGYAIALALILVGSAAYSFAERAVPSVVGRVFGVGIAAVAVGCIAIVPVRMGRFRSALLAGFVGASLGLVALWAMWIVWLHEFLSRLSRPPGYWDLVRHPIGCWELVRFFGVAGTTRFRGRAMQGAPLYIAWLAEAGVVLYSAVKLPIRSLAEADDPVCVSCRGRCTSVGNLPRFSAVHAGELLDAVTSRRFAPLAAFPAPPDSDAPELILTLHTCPSCGQTNTVTVRRAAYVLAKGRPILQFDTLLNRMLLPQDDAIELVRVSVAIEAARSGESPGDETAGDETPEKPVAQPQ